MEHVTIKEFYKEKNFLLTGGTGFVGLAIIEKILRCLPSSGNIYVLIRPKKGKQIEERLEDIVKNAVFGRLREEKGEDSFKKLIPIAGDVGEENLGLSGQDKQTLVENVNVVIHSAATLDFEASLKSTVSVNLLGTRRIVALCKEIHHLSALLHISSAYVNSHVKDPEEILYTTPENSERVIEMVQSVDEKTLKDMTPSVLGAHVNTYTFTKALAEHEVAKSISFFPSCILRPSMIVGAWQEPIPGWTISKNGPQGFIMGILKGVIRRLPLDPDIIVDYIPIDIVVNGVLVGACHAATTRPEKTPICHITSSKTKPFRWRYLLENKEVEKVVEEFPIEGAIWYPSVKFIPSLFWFKISSYIFHFLPGFILDFILILTGGRPKLVRLHKSVNASVTLLESFIFSEWVFDNKNTLALHENLSDQDKKEFGLDVSGIIWAHYFKNLFIGIRQFLHNEPPSTIEAAKKKQKMLLLMNILVQIIFISLLSAVLCIAFGFSWFNFLFGAALLWYILSLL